MVVACRCAENFGKEGLQDCTPLKCLSPLSKHNRIVASGVDIWGLFERHQVAAPRCVHVALGIEIRKETACRSWAVDVICTGNHANRTWCDLAPNFANDKLGKR